MNLQYRTTLGSALAIALLTIAPSVSAQPAEAGAEAGGEEEGAEGAEEGEGADKPKEPPPPAVDLGGWGIGGKEEEGRYKPRGRTGKLKEMEGEEEDSPDAETPTVLPPPGYAYLDTVLGFGSTNVVVQPGDTTDVTPTASFLIGLGYRIGDTWQLGARFPISTGASDGPVDPFIADARDPDSYKQIAVGGVELEVKPHFILGRTLRLPVGLALVIPTQTGDMWADPDNLGDRGVAIVNQAAAESRGYEDRALFQHKRFGIVPSVGILFDDDGFEIGAQTKVELMIRVGGEDPPELSTGDVRGVVVNWVTGGHFYYGFFDGLLAPGLRAWLAVGNTADVTDAQDYDGAQLAFEPTVKSDIPFTDDAMVGMNVGAGVILPVLGNPPQGNGSMTGLRIRAGMFF